MKPLLLGYRNTRVDASMTAEVESRHALEEFAEREGFMLGTIFTDRDVNRPLSAFTALIGAARSRGTHVVAVPTWWDLGSLPWVRQQCVNVFNVRPVWWSLP